MKKVSLFRLYISILRKQSINIYKQNILCKQSINNKKNINNI